MDRGGYIGAFLYGQATAVAIASLIGAVFLPAVCALYNKLAGGSGSPTSVPEPSMSKAMGIMFVASLVNAVLAFFIGLVITAWGSAAGVRQLNVTTTVYLLSLPICLLVMAGMLAGMLPTTFGRAFLVTLLYLAVVVLVVGIVVGIIVLILSFFGGNRYFRVLGWSGD